MKEFLEAWSHVDRNKVALILSVVPGLGHLYKHHYWEGSAILIPGNVIALFVALWLSFATVGFSLLLVPAIWIAGVACAAYFAPDWHPHRHVWPAATRL